ncbi:DnaJ domain-containing protein [Clostridium sp. USBA 49]|jgi:curved DNA-binding protein CbpA|uniref:J domain-containing protein n=1 Tax=Clostridium TaxID=1485 RepID=UPI00099ACACA|nr:MULTISPECIES: DnaJ domain-containing protein [Clostridium]SKA84295.1 DnaJ domain-containing protein [Clostridium sp. USBA 49]
MKNPYEVLQIKEGASKDEIKKAYKELVKKYHPDQYGNNPLRDLAEEKLREINEAYDYLMNNSNSTYSQNYNSSTSSSYNDIRIDLQNGNLRAAEEKLTRISVRDAEWNYLMGILYLKKGWYDNAYNYIVNACNLDPNNFEYRQTLNNLQRRNTGYRQTYYNTNRGDGDLCNTCTTIWCLDSCCECMGGDLIDCC